MSVQWTWTTFTWNKIKQFILVCWTWFQEKLDEVVLFLSLQWKWSPSKQWPLTWIHSKKFIGWTGFRWLIMPLLGFRWLEKGDWIMFEFLVLWISLLSAELKEMLMQRGCQQPDRAQCWRDTSISAQWCVWLKWNISCFLLFWRLQTWVPKKKVSTSWTD